MTKRFKLASVNGGSTATAATTTKAGSRTLPISFGRKLEGLEAAAESSSSPAADSHHIPEAAAQSDLSGINASPAAIVSATSSTKTPGRFNSIRKWFRPWRWMKSKRDGNSGGKESRKSAEMEDVAVAGHDAALYGEDFSGVRKLTDSSTDASSVGNPGLKSPAFNDPSHHPAGASDEPINIADIKVTFANSPAISKWSYNLPNPPPSVSSIKKSVRIHDSVTGPPQHDQQGDAATSGGGGDAANHRIESINRGPRDGKSSPIAQQTHPDRFTTETMVLRSQPISAPSATGRSVQMRLDDDSPKISSPSLSSSKPRTLGELVLPRGNGSPVVGSLGLTQQLAPDNNNSSVMESAATAAATQDEQSGTGKVAVRRRVGISGEHPSPQLTTGRSASTETGVMESSRQNSSGNPVTSGNHLTHHVPILIETPDEEEAPGSRTFHHHNNISSHSSSSSSGRHNNNDDDTDGSDESHDSFDEPESDSDSEASGLGKKVIRKDSLAIHLEAKRTGRRLSEVRVGREIVPDLGRKAELSEIGNRLQRRLSLRPTPEDLAQRNILRDEMEKALDIKERQDTLARKLSFRPTIEQLKELKIIRFNDYVAVNQVEEWDRKADKPWTRLTPKDKAAIRKELNDFKKAEMEVHEQSKQYTRFHRP
ncbi:putative Phosphatase and actin regulator 4 [Hypsibius exemplaris]|uniref:Phosphatase and actin regulator 4 n=1 Tax=Hypsibius exemplaris TaxID=2072580 RepID=A0A1W0WYU4_HYPEX|nr:putative Phosphatase and actin regulator 4 [Hypsibius exemplaris]